MIIILQIIIKTKRDTKCYIDGIGHFQKDAYYSSCIKRKVSIFLVYKTKKCRVKSGKVSQIRKNHATVCGNQFHPVKLGVSRLGTHSFSPWNYLPPLFPFCQLSYTSIFVFNIHNHEVTTIYHIDGIGCFRKKM